MRVLHLITSLRTGGAEKLMVDLLPRLRDKGIDVEICLHDGFVTPFRNELEAKGIKVFDLGKKGLVYSPLKFLKLIPHLKDYDIIHTHNTASQFFGAAGKAFSSLKLFTTEHAPSNRRRDLKWCKPLDRWLYSRYNNVICISRKAEENLREYIGNVKTNILTINNGIPTKKYSNAFPSTELEKIAPGTKKILSVAAFRWEKDQPTLIKAMNFLPVNFHLFLVGDGGRREEYETLINDLNLQERVHLLGLRNDVPELLKAADYVVMSSHFEGLSLSSVEGMAAGKPMIASDVDGLREVVGGAGILFEHENPEDLASRIRELDGNPKLYEETARKCSERAKEYDIEKMADEYSKSYVGTLR